MNAIGRALAKKAANKKGHRAILLGGAIVVESFNVVTEPIAIDAGGDK